MMLAAVLASAQTLQRVDTTLTVDDTRISVIEAYKDVASQSNYDKVVVYLHGGGSSGNADYSAVATNGLFGTDIDNIKFIFPTSTIAGGVWYETYKEGSISNCDFGMFSECAYNLNDMRKSGK